MPLEYTAEFTRPYDGTNNPEFQRGHVAHGSRHISLFHVQEPIAIVARFVYNFFVPDERTNADGHAAFQGSVGVAHTRSEELNRAAQLPRFVEIAFPAMEVGYLDPGGQFFSGVLNLLNGSDALVTTHTEMIQTEETVTTIQDVDVKLIDPGLVDRMKQKAELLSSLLGAAQDTAAEKTTAITSMNGRMDYCQLLAVLSKQKDTVFVNEIGDVLEPVIFTKAATLLFNAFVDRRYMIACFAGNYASRTALQEDLTSIAVDDSYTYMLQNLSDSHSSTRQPTIRILSRRRVGELDVNGQLVPTFDDAGAVIKTMTAGYIIERRERRADGTLSQPTKYYLDRANNSTFIDTRVVYGSTYTYSVRTVALADLPINYSAQIKFWVTALIASTPSTPQTVKAIEYVAPKPPDGVFYQFNYSAGRGLVITWQSPIGKQRDVRYYQVFRRKTIHEPYVCIAQLDFDDSEIKAPKKEYVSEDVVIKSSRAVNTFMDARFDRTISYMYAVAAVDAHGLSSGYSAQTMVSFNADENQMELKNISPAGAPKQYPNFFIDPELDDNTFVDSLTQDSMKSSRKQSMRVYFDPDVVNYITNDVTTTTTNGITTTTTEEVPNQLLHITNREGGMYKLLLLNVDRQKSATLELEITDATVD